MTKSSKLEPLHITVLNTILHINSKEIKAFLFVTIFSRDFIQNNLKYLIKKELNKKKINFCINFLK